MPSKEFWGWLRSIETRDVIAVLLTVGGLILVGYLFCSGRDELAFQIVTAVITGVGGYSAGRPNTAPKAKGEEMSE